MRGADALRPGAALGAAVRRLEDPRLLTGRGRYLDDVVLPGLLHAAFVRSPHAHARLGRVDTAAARALPGVATVLTGADLAGRVAPLAPELRAPGFHGTAWPALPTERVRFAGEAVAVVAAADPYVAADAAERVEVEWAPLPALAGIEAAAAPGAPVLHGTAPGNLLFERYDAQGDAEAAFARAAHVVRETFTHGRASAAPLEPRGLLAEWAGDRLTVWCGSQVPFLLRRALARALSLSEGQVRVIVTDTGGGFGQKMHVLPEDLVVAALARALGRPVKWVETRRENLVAASQAREARVAVEAAADAEGRVLALRARVDADAGAYHVHPVTAALEPLGTAGILPGPYRVPAYAWQARAWATTKPPVGAYRGVGMTLGVLAMERTLDLLAARLGLDPAEVRRRNLIPREAYPFTSAAGFTYDSGDLPGVLSAALELAGYGDWRAGQAEARRQGRLVGIGLACFTESTGIGAATFRRRGMAEVPGPESASVRVESDGSVTCLVSFPSQGQGHATTVAQVVAAELGVPVERIRVLQPDTGSATPGSGTFASRGAVVQGGAVRGAAAEVRGKLLTLAAGLLEASPADLELADGRVGVLGAPGRSLPVAELARLAHHPPAGGLPGGLAPGLDATRAFDPPGPAFSSAVHLARVEVDRGTGRVRVLDYVVVEDCGPLINPLVVEGQIHGAVAQGLGEALRERLVYDEAGQPLSATFMEYAIPTAADLPAFVVAHRSTPSPLTPGGYKGMGEGGTVGAPACIASAVADAVRPLGVGVTALPIAAESLRSPVAPG
jgi:carbon-monoxide dehydrogenase large subunit